MSDTPESPQPEDAKTSPSPATPAAPKSPAKPVTPTAAAPASPRSPASPAVPTKPITPRANPNLSFENLAEKKTTESNDNFTVDEDESPNKAGILIDTIAAAVAIAFTALLLKDVLPFLS